MARVTKPLTDTQIKQAKPKAAEYSLSDGAGLALRVKPDLTPDFRTMNLMRFPATLSQRRSQHEETIHRRANYQSYQRA